MAGCIGGTTQPKMGGVMLSQYERWTTPGGAVDAAEVVLRWPSSATVTTQTESEVGALALAGGVD